LADAAEPGIESWDVALADEGLEFAGQGLSERHLWAEMIIEPGTVGVLFRSELVLVRATLPSSLLIGWGFGERATAQNLATQRRRFQSQSAPTSP
jgi:hypothetical protein